METRSGSKNVQIGPTGASLSENEEQRSPNFSFQNIYFLAHFSENFMTPDMRKNAKILETPSHSKNVEISPTGASLSENEERRTPLLSFQNIAFLAHFSENFMTPDMGKNSKILETLSDSKNVEVGLTGASLSENEERRSPNSNFSKY